FINKKVVFRTKKKNITTAVRYLAVSVFVMLLSTELIVIINKLFLTEKNTVAKFVKLPVDFAMFFVSYFLQKKWVFAPRKKKTV
ncbi:MAG: GtrA family protein, partial [Eubacteriales bacterium]|nr:GtrA family protein [Eubacteriales bacterium]